MSATVDTNILTYASNATDPLHGRAESLVRCLAAGPEVLYLFWPVLLGYVRIVTHSGILPRPLTARQAMANVEALLDRPHVRAPGEADGFWASYRSVGDRARGKEVPYAHLVALMRQSGVRLITPAIARSGCSVASSHGIRSPEAWPAFLRVLAERIN